MRLEIIIDRKHQIPTATMEALRQELLKQLGEQFPDLHVRVAPGSAMALTVSRASKEDRELAEAMDCRCYNGGKGRTRMKKIVAGRRDFLSLFLLAVVFSSIIILQIIF